MRILTVLGLTVLAVSLRPVGVAGQEAREATVQAAMAVEARIDPRLLVTTEERRVALDRAEWRRVDLEEWNLYGLMEYMAWGIVPGAVVGAVYAGATEEAGLMGPAVIVMGAIMGTGVGMAAGGVVYTIRML